MGGRSENYISSIICACFLALCISPARAGPLNIEGPSREVSNNSLAEFDSLLSRGCRYKSLLYSNYEEVSTDEPCLACQCKGTAVVCKLRICPEIPVPPPPGCIVVHKAKSCCSQLVCYGQEHAKKISREQRFPAYVSGEALMSSVSNETKDPGFCVLDGTVYAEGSAMRSSTLCQYCFCIRGEMKCSEPQCVIPLKGCDPQFRSYACCPTNYDCGKSNETAILKTLPSSTQVPQFLKGCLVNGQFVPEGEPVLPVQLAGYGANATINSNNVCQTCFCMGGVVHCRPLECDRPIDGCTPIKEDGHCCPDRYDCSAKPTATSVMTTAEDITELPSDPSSSGWVTEEMEIFTSNSGRQVDASMSATTFVSVFNEMDSSTASANEDSFERVASSVIGSSEESTIHPTIQYTRIPLPNGGFKNRSDLLGSREERRSKDGDEIARKHSIEDDEKEEFTYHTLETTVSNAIEELAATTVFDDVINESTQDPDIESDASGETDATSINNLSVENVTGNYVSEEEDQEATTNQDSNKEANSINTEETNEPSNTQVTEEEKLEESPATTPISTTPKPEPSNMFSTESREGIPSSSESSSTSMSIEEHTTSKPSSTTKGGNLEFIPFALEDARVQMSKNETTYSTAEADDMSSEIVHNPPETNIPVLKPFELKFLNGSEDSSKKKESLEDPLPIIVEADIEPLNQYNVTSFVPVSTSLYSNGYYPHGDIIKDDGPADELIVSQAEIETAPDNKNKKDQEEQEEVLNQVPHNQGSVSHVRKNSKVEVTSARPTRPAAVHIDSRNRFAPSYAPQPHFQFTSPPLVNSNSPTRTYSKFGMQDAPLYRYDHGALDGNGFAYTPQPPETNYHHRYYNEPEDFPPSRTPGGYNYYNTYSNKDKVSKPPRTPGVGMLPPMYKDNQFFYEDSSAALDSYEDYETYFQASSRPSTPPTPVTGPSASKISTTPSPSIQFLGERVRLPSYNQQRSTSTPKYKYAYLNNNKVTLQTKPVTEKTTTRSDFKPLAQFPFSLPRNQDNLYNLGIKLSGCNVVGKMYSVGEIIEELSSDCLRCMCSDIGVHCAELKC